jgi:hypothetical protein
LRLAEGASVRGVAAVETIAALPAAPDPVPAPPAVAVPDAMPAVAASGMQLVRTAPNVYELRTTPAATAPATAMARLEIANGHGADGLARRFQETLALRGIVATRLTNMPPFGQATTRIEFAPGQETAARRLQAALGGKPPLRLAERDALPGGMRLVLGKDAPLALAQAKPLLAASAAPVSTHPMQ